MVKLNAGSDRCKRKQIGRIEFLNLHIKIKSVGEGGMICRLNERSMAMMDNLQW